MELLKVSEFGFRRRPYLCSRSFDCLAEEFREDGYSPKWAMISSHDACLATFLVVVISFGAFGCEEAVFPVVGEERPYTIWGLFNAGADTQKVRVFEINDHPGFEDDEELDAVVVSTDLTIGETRVWHHRRRVDESGDVRHIFWSAFQAERGHR